MTGTTPRPRPTRPHRTRACSVAIATVEAMLRTVNMYDPREQRACEQRARKILDVIDASIANGNHLLRYVIFAGAFLMKMVEFRREPFFREGRTNMPCPCWFSRAIKDAFDILRLSDLAHTRWPLANSTLEHYYIRGYPHGKLVSVLDHLNAHVHASNIWLSTIRFQRSLEERAGDIVYNMEYVHPSGKRRDSWYIGAPCRTTWSGDDKGFYHDAKIVWISKFRRTCRIVYACWDGWGWETTEYPTLIKNLAEYDHQTPLLCPLCDDYDDTHDILCDRYV